MKKNYDVIVIGTGGVGSSAVFHLANKGVSVLGLDRFPAAHDRGSSHGLTRVIRKAYFEHPGYVPLLHRAYELWDELQAESSQPLFHRHPLIEVGPPDGLIVPGVLEAARVHHLQVDTLSETDFCKTCPGLILPEGAVALRENDAGILFVENCVREHLKRATQAGATILVDVEVLNWKSDGENVQVETTQGHFSAARLVITAGAWAGQMLADCRIPFQILRKHLHWFESDETTEATAGFPLFFYEVADGFFYGFPKLDSTGVKVAEHSGGEVVADPLAVDRSPDPEDSRRVESFAQNYLKGVSRQRNRHSVCIYTMSPDGNFIVDRHPEFSNVAFTAGLSGHGFKFASILGEVMADLALGEAIPDPMKFLSVSRIVPC